MNKNRPILVIEDDYVDALTVKRALSDNAIFNEVIFKSNGEDALAYLQDQSAELPAIILLDLN
nr:response regulator [Candidatus Cloacimonadota bacterium]